MQDHRQRHRLRLLRREVENHLGDSEILSCYAEALLLAGKKREAEKVYRYALEYLDFSCTAYYGTKIFLRCMEFILKRNDPQEDEVIKQIYTIAAEWNPQISDIDYLMSFWAAAHRQWQNTVNYLERAIEKEKSEKDSMDRFLKYRAKKSYQFLLEVSEKLQDKPRMVKYGMMMLGLDKYQDEVLDLVLSLFKEISGEAEETARVYRILNHVYNFESLKDKLYVLRRTKISKYEALEDKVFSSLTEEEQEWLQSEGKKEEQESLIQNAVDASFYALMDHVRTNSQGQLLEEIIRKMENLKEKAPRSYELIVAYFRNFPFWGRLDPDCNLYQAYEKRIWEVKKHSSDFIWMYKRLSDYRSRRVMLAIIRNWVFLDMDALAKVKDLTDSYFDPDVFPTGNQDVFVDLGAYIGDTVKSYIKTYGYGYQRIYCYEMNPEIIAELKKNLSGFHDIDIRQKAAGMKAEIQHMSRNKYTESANMLSNKGDLNIETVRIDEDIKEPVTFIKMDIEGSEQAALAGCERLIRGRHPKLAISVYHNYEDIWKIARMIEEMDPTYQFYLRYYGGNLVPMEYVLLAV